MKTRTYNLPGDRGNGWAKIVIDDAGFFGCASDYGNYAFHWTHFGDSFREFLASLNADYVSGKLSGGHQVLDLEATQGRLMDAIKDITDEASEEEDYSELEELSDAIRACNEKEELEDILKDQDIIEEWWDYFVYGPELQLKGFLKVVWPEFVSVLKSELSGENWWK